MTTSQTLPANARRQVLVLMCTALAIVVGAMISLNIALPSFAADTGASQSELTWVVGAYGLVFAALLLPAGSLADRFGRQEVLVGGLVLFAASSLASAFVDTPEAVIALRVIAAIGAAAVMPSTLSILTNAYPPEERGKAVGAWAGVAGAAGVLGILVAGGLLEAFSWQSIFLVNAGFAGLVALAIARRVPTSRDPDATPIDGGGVALSVLGLSAIVYAVIEAPVHGWTSARFLITMVTGVAALALFVAWELRAKNPLLDPRLFASAPFAAGSLVITIQFFAVFAFQFVGLQYLQQVSGYSALQAGLALLPIGIILQTIAPRAPQLAARHGMRAVVGTGSLLIAAGLLVLAQLETDSGYWVFLAGTLVMGAGMALSAAPATEAVLNGLPAAKQGVASAVNDVTRELGGALGIAVLGSLLNQGYRSTIDDKVGNADGLRDAVRPSLQAAEQASQGLGSGGDRVVDVAQGAFVHGLHLAFYSGAAVVLIGTAAFLLIALRKAKAVEPDVQDHAAVLVA